jgi:transcriptional regulator with XRE-family HTH domain
LGLYTLVNNNGIRKSGLQMDEPGHRLKQARERLNLTYRDVSEASVQIAKRHGNDEFLIALSRLSDIENKGTVPSIYRLYSLCTIYRLELPEVLDWYGVSLARQGADAASISISKTHPISFQSGHFGELQVPLSLDPGVDFRKTTFLSRVIQRWGALPLSLLSGSDVKNLRYAFVGADDWSMYPLIQPESLILIDETLRKIASSGWTNEFDRPIYFVEHRSGYFIGWCTLVNGSLIVSPHPASRLPPQVFLSDEVDVIGQISGVAMRFDQSRRRQSPA